MSIASSTGLQGDSCSLRIHRGGGANSGNMYNNGRSPLVSGDSSFLKPGAPVGDSAYHSSTSLHIPYDVNCRNRTPSPIFKRTNNHMHDDVKRTRQQVNNNFFKVFFSKNFESFKDLRITNIFLLAFLCTFFSI